MKSNARNLYKALTAIFVASIVFSLVVFIGGWSYIFNLSSSLGQARTESEYLTKEVETLNELNIKYKKVANSHLLALDSIPIEKQLSSYMADIETLAAKNGLKIKETMVGVSSKTKLSDMSLSQMVKQEGYYVLPVKFTFEGNYSNFTNFINDVYSLRRVTAISDVNIIKSSKALAERKDEIRAEFLTSIYVKK